MECLLYVIILKPSSVLLRVLVYPIIKYNQTDVDYLSNAMKHKNFDPVVAS
jgi:hypothetical protein